MSDWIRLKKVRPNKKDGTWTERQNHRWTNDPGPIERTLELQISVMETEREFIIRVRKEQMDEYRMD